MCLKETVASICCGLQIQICSRTHTHTHTHRFAWKPINCRYVQIQKHTLRVRLTNNTHKLYIHTDYVLMQKCTQSRFTGCSSWIYMKKFFVKNSSSVLAGPSHRTAQHKLSMYNTSTFHHWLWLKYITLSLFSGSQTHMYRCLCTNTITHIYNTHTQMHAHMHRE